MNDPIPSGTVNYTPPQCIHCSTPPQAIRLSFRDLQIWHQGTYIQHAFPYLDAPTRELIKTGIHPACWEDIFATTEEEE